MNTIANTVSRRISRALAVLAVMVASLVAVTMTATPAHAATSIYGCFRSSSGLSIEGTAVHLQAWTTRGWSTIWSSTLPRSQCVNVSTPYHANYYLKYVVDQTRFGARWYGESPNIALPSYTSANVGTGVVNCYGCFAN